MNGFGCGASCIHKEGGILKKFRTAGLLTVTLVFCAVMAFASEDASSGSKLPDLLYRVITFAIVAFLVYKFAGKRIVALFTGRSRQIEVELADLDERRTEAQDRLREVEESIADLEAERSRILAEATAQGEAMRRAIIDKAEAQALQIKAQAEIAAAQEAKQAIDAIRAELAEKITSAAEELVKKQLKKKDHEELVNEYLKKVVLN